MYPLKFEKIYKKKLWGEEKWELSVRKEEKSVIKNGSYAGITLEELIKLKGEEVVGKDFKEKEFPILIKIIEAREKLSVQVHPDKLYAINNEKERGKSEFWYILNCSEKASLIIGTNCIDIEVFKKALAKGELDSFLRRVFIKKGDSFFINSGTLHAINENITILEVQDNSDITYRIYDYNRGRELHIKKALEVINLEKKESKDTANIKIELLEIKGELNSKSYKESFFVYYIIEGNFKILFKGGEEILEERTTLLIPSALGEFKIKGKGKILRAEPLV